MNRKLLGATFGALILSSSGCAVIDDRSDPHPSPRSYSGDGWHWGRPGLHSPEYRDHDFHDRSPTHPYGYSRLAPNWGSHDYDHRSRHGYGDDGVTTTLRGRDG